MGVRYTDLKPAGLYTGFTDWAKACSRQGVTEAVVAA